MNLLHGVELVLFSTFSKASRSVDMVVLASSEAVSTSPPSITPLTASPNVATLEWLKCPLSRDPREEDSRIGGHIIVAFEGRRV